MASLVHDRYGKSAIRLVRVARRVDRHDVDDLSVAVSLEGRFAAAYTDGDNRSVLPTDTMKNTVYALARREGIAEVESFAIALGRHFLADNPDVLRARIDIAAHRWDRIEARGRPHPHAFARRGPERRLARVTAAPGSIAVEAGVEDLLLLKTAGSAFAGFRRDAFTTLRDTEDRLLATAMRATWRYGSTDLAFAEVWRGIRATLLATFADHDSRSVQHTLYAMADAVLASFDDVMEISLSMPNQHHVPVDLAPFGLENPNEIFVATTEPHGLIEATVRRELHG